MAPIAARVSNRASGSGPQSKIRRLHPSEWVGEPGHEPGQKSKIGCLLALAVVCTTSLFAQESPRGAHDVTRIYVPTEDFAAIVSRDKQGVLLPKNEFA